MRSLPSFSQIDGTSVRRHGPALARALPCATVAAENRTEENERHLCPALREEHRRLNRAGDILGGYSRGRDGGDDCQKERKGRAISASCRSGLSCQLRLRRACRPGLVQRCPYRGHSRASRWIEQTSRGLSASSGSAPLVIITRRRIDRGGQLRETDPGSRRGVRQAHLARRHIRSRRLLASAPFANIRRQHEPAAIIESPSELPVRAPGAMSGHARLALSSGSDVPWPLRDRCCVARSITPPERPIIAGY